MPFNELDQIGPARKGLIFEQETYEIVGAAMEVYYKLGSGFLEPVYQEALAMEFTLRGIPFEEQKELRIEYKGQLLNKAYFADFLCFGEIIVEIKSLVQLTPPDWSQIINYLKVSRLKVGLLFNFGNSVKLEQKRLVV
ncbi:MAG: GxxExxY protein [Pyrinomonadaceae bacterium]